MSQDVKLWSWVLRDERVFTGEETRGEYFRPREQLVQ